MLLTDFAVFNLSVSDVPMSFLFILPTSQNLKFVQTQIGDTLLMKTQQDMNEFVNHHY